MKYEQLDKLPTTRAYLHFEAIRTNGGSVQVDYELVLPLGEVDCRGTFNHRGRNNRPKSHALVWLDDSNNRRIPLGHTLIRTSNADYPFSKCDGSIDLPFRDCAHCCWDNEKLGGLKIIYSVCENHWLLIPEDKKGQS